MLVFNPVLSRVYTREFGQSLVDAFAFHRPRPTLRQKPHVSPQKTDLRIFSGLDLKETWVDAALVDVYIYIRGGTTNKVSNSWDTATAAQLLWI